MKNTAAYLPLPDVYASLNHFSIQSISAPIRVDSTYKIQYHISSYIDPDIDKLTRFIGSIFHSSWLTRQAF